MYDLQFVSIDLEATGRDAETDMMLELGAGISTVGEEVFSPFKSSIRILVVNPDNAKLLCSLEVLRMHSKLWVELHECQVKMKKEDKEVLAFPVKKKSIENEEFIHQTWAVRPNKVYPIFRKWLKENIPDIGTKQLNAAGKNFSIFDYKMMVRNDPDFGTLFRNMVLDPAILYYLPDDTKLPGLSECLDRMVNEYSLNPDNRKVAASCVAGLAPHSAVDDALAVAWLIRHRLGHR